jgi:hypothetical protein
MILLTDLPRIVRGGPSSGPDGKGQAKGQARNARGKPSDPGPIKRTGEETSARTQAEGTTLAGLRWL